MQLSRRRIRSRRVASLASVAVLTLAVSTSAGTGHLITGSTTPGPVAPAREALRACMIHGSSSVQMPEGIPTPAGYVRSTGTVTP